MFVVFWLTFSLELVNFGVYDACLSDCKSGQTYSDGHCNAPQYSGDFHAWTPNENCYGGGVLDPSGCDALVNKASQTFVDHKQTVVYGCKAALEQHYHQNFQVNFKQLQCPKSLCWVTGIKSKDGYVLTSVHINLKLENRGQATSTMNCCKPTSTT